ncbi:hypothetical protein [Nostoc sp.]|uniref:hypothetical protein n=1 Tax=Nostoc sp. TaxID=1180 RepID=UPI002FF5AB85
MAHLDYKTIAIADVNFCIRWFNIPTKSTIWWGYKNAVYIDVNEIRDILADFSSESG